MIAAALAMLLLLGVTPIYAAMPAFMDCQPKAAATPSQHHAVAAHPCCPEAGQPMNLGTARSDCCYAGKLPPPSEGVPQRFSENPLPSAASATLGDASPLLPTRQRPWRGPGGDPTTSPPQRLAQLRI